MSVYFPVHLQFIKNLKPLFTLLHGRTLAIQSEQATDFVNNVPVGLLAFQAEMISPIRHWLVLVL